ncbi:MAG: sulfatase-like hydrolase/transferase [Chloroflexi bacterium]|nr:sulfatase-like hydrolase/transferase [Chloroflexota bacterium]MCL5273555.1 sulfatase-like hydrolase/transferase [Chloroflexota bacterium]
MKKKPNLIFFGIDSLRADHMSLFGYDRLTSPHIGEYAAGGASFSSVTSPSIPTTPGYTSMFTGMDCFSTDVVALRHEGGLGSHNRTLAEILGEQGYNTTCVGFSGNPASRGFQKYLDFEGWGSWETGRSPKAENLNAVAIPELQRLSKEEQPFFLFLRHMDPHAPYLPPRPFERMFYAGDETDPDNHSLDPVYSFKPFRDFHASWFPPNCTDAEYVIAQYDAEIAYMDACIANIFSQISQLRLEEDTLVVIDSDHGETLADHGLYFDHHGLYECTLHIPLIFVWPGHVPSGLMFDDMCYMKDITPTILDLMGVAPKPRIKFDGRSLRPLMLGEPRVVEPETYITEATWMRKHGWRTPQWKLIHALEPDFHFKPEVELYDLIADPGESRNLAEEQPDVVKMLEERMLAHIERRTKATGRPNPMYTNLNWHGHGGGPFKTSQQAYDTMYIGSPKQARALQAKELRTQRGAKKL